MEGDYLKGKNKKKKIQGINEKINHDAVQEVSKRSLDRLTESRRVVSWFYHGFIVVTSWAQIGNPLIVPLSNHST